MIGNSMIVWGVVSLLTISDQIRDRVFVSHFENRNKIICSLSKFAPINIKMSQLIPLCPLID